MKRIYTNGHTYYLKPGAEVTETNAELPTPTEEITLQANVTLYRKYWRGFEEKEGEEPREFLQERD